MMETKGTTNALSFVLFTVCMAFSKHVSYRVLLYFLLHLARVSVPDDGGTFPINDTNSSSNNKYY